MVQAEHEIADAILEEIKNTTLRGARENLLMEYQRICQASKDRADSDLMTMEILDMLDEEEEK